MVSSKDGKVSILITKDSIDVDEIRNNMGNVPRVTRQVSELKEPKWYHDAQIILKKIDVKFIQKVTYIPQELC